MIKNFRKYHRSIAIAACTPLVLTVVTGDLITFTGERLGQGEVAETIRKVHALEIIHLEKIFPLLNAIGLVGLLVTGLSMSGLFRKRPRPKGSEAVIECKVEQRSPAP
jgi:hypothetical protein